MARSQLAVLLPTTVIGRVSCILACLTGCCALAAASCALSSQRWAVLTCALLADRLLLQQEQQQQQQQQQQPLSTLLLASATAQRPCLAQLAACGRRL